MNNQEYIDYDFYLKLLIIGDSGVGKSNIVSRFFENTFTPFSLTTIGKINLLAACLKMLGIDVKSKIMELEGKK